MQILSCYGLFVTATDILKCVWSRYRTTSTSIPTTLRVDQREEYVSRHVGTPCIRMLSFIKTWLQQHPEDFSVKPQMKILMDDNIDYLLQVGHHDLSQFKTI